MSALWFSFLKTWHQRFCLKGYIDQGFYLILGTGFKINRQFALWLDCKYWAGMVTLVTYLSFLGKMMASPKLLLLITVACGLLQILPIPALFTFSESPLGQLLWTCWGYDRVTHWPPHRGRLPLLSIGYRLTPSILWPRILLGYVQEIPRNWAWIEDFTFIFLKCLKIWFCCLVWGLQRSM